MDCSTIFLFVVGTLAAQALSVVAPEEFYKLIAESKILTLIPKRITPESAAVAFECIKKFVHPVKGEFKQAKDSKLLTEIKMDVVNGFLSQT